MNKTKTDLSEPLIEASVLGAILIDEKSILEISRFLKPHHFYNSIHKEIYSTMIELHSENTNIDSITVYKKSINVDAIYIERLKDSVISTANIVKHSQILVETWLRIETIKEIDKIKGSIISNSDDIFQIISNMVQKLEDKINIKGPGKSDLTISERLSEFFNNLETERRQEKDITLKSCDFPTFNRATGGLRDGDYLLITGKWKRGKSRFGNALAADFAVNNKVALGLITFEMSDVEFIKMIVSLRLGIRYEYLRDPGYRNKEGELRFNDDSFLNIKLKAEKEFSYTKIYINDGIATDYELFNSIRYWVHKYKVNIILIDYLQLIQSVKRYEAKRLQIDELSAGLKNLARTLKIKIIVIVQENEQGKTNEARGPIRDCDFWLSTSYPFADGKSYIKINNKKVDVDESHFIIQYKESRHTKAGGKWINIFNQDGTYKEFTADYEGVKNNIS